MSKSEFEELFSRQLALSGLPEPTREHRPIANRRWRVDFAWIEDQVAIEIEGGIWARGRHIRPSGFIGDIEKYNTLALEGWIVLRLTPEMVESGEGLRLAERALGC